MIRLHRGYLIVAALATLILSGLGIWLIPDLRQSPLTILMFVGGLLASVVGVLANFRQAFEVPDNTPQTYASKPKNGVVLDRETSVERYLANLEAIVRELGITPSKFVELSAETDQVNTKGDIDLLQNFEWAQLHWLNETPIIRREPIEILRAHEKFQRYILLGDPGSGKTTSLQYLILAMINQFRLGQSRLLPVYISLADWRDPRISALEYIAQEFTNIAGPRSSLSKEFEALLSSGDLLLILDGLNEMPGRRYFHHKAERVGVSLNELVHEAASGNLFASRQDPRERSLRDLATSVAVRSRFIISCRIHEFYGSPSWQEIYILPMNDEQVSTFVKKHLGEIASEFESLLSSNSSLRGLAANPFFLLNMISVFKPDLAMVRGPGQFMEYLLNNLLDRERQRGSTVKKSEVFRAGRLAFQMLSRDMIGSQFDLREVGQNNQRVLQILLKTGLVVARGDRIYFYHQLIQEFFAAIALKERCVFAPLDTLLCNKKWSEVFILWHDIDPKSKLFSALVRRLTLRNRPWTIPFSPPGSLQFWSLMALIGYSFLVTNLAMDLVFGGRLLNFAINSPLTFLSLFFIVPIALRYVWLFWTYHSEGIGNSAYILGRIGNVAAIPHLIEAFRRVAPSSVAATDIANALAQFGEVAIPHLRLSLTSDDPKIRSGVLVALGCIGGQETADILIPILRAREADILKSALEAAGRIDDPRIGSVVLETLQATENIANLQTAFQSVFGALGIRQRPGPSFLKDLYDAVNDKGLSVKQRNLVIQAAATFGHSDFIAPFSKIIRDAEEPDSVRAIATRSLGKMKGPTIVSEILRIYNEVPERRGDALMSLEIIRDPESLEALHSLLHHPDWQVRDAVVKSIWLTGNPKSAPHLVEVVNDENPTVRNQIVWALSAIGGAEALEPLCQLAHDPVREIRIAALDNLDFFHPTTAREIFIDLAKDLNYPERVKAIEKLANHRHENTRSALLALSIDFDQLVKEEAIEALRQIDGNLAQQVRLNTAPSQRHKSIFLRLWPSMSHWFQVDDLIALISETRFGSIAELSVLNRSLSENATPTNNDVTQERSSDPQTLTNVMVWLQAFTLVIIRLSHDAELKRKFHLTFLVLLGLLLGLFCIAPGIFVAILARLTVFIGGFVWHVWLASAITLGLALLSYLPYIRNGSEVKYLSAVYRILRTSGAVILLTGFIFIAARYWWISLALLVTIFICLYLARHRIWAWMKELPNQLRPESVSS